MEKYLEPLYLLGCYLVVADKEINALEVEVLDELLQGKGNDELSMARNRIFSDSEDKPDYHHLLNQMPLVCQNKEQKERVIRFLAQVACADGFVGLQKQHIINDVATSLRVSHTDILEEEKKLVEEDLENARMSRFMRLWGGAQKVYYDSFANKSKQQTLDKMFGGVAFQSILERITDQALVDYKRVSHIMDALGQSLHDTHQKITNLSSIQSSDKKDFEEIQKILADLNNSYRDLIDVSYAENLEMLDKKQRNIRYFTIAFMGRTKAGKSTLHKVMTQENSDDIGVGKLRTTRYNRSWYWDKLRIVDTPGIGAPGGEVDTDIAKSIIDEADLICYVVTNDSIQETEFNFFSTIKEHNKPLYIVLNVKSNLSDSKRLEKFLENPTKWKDTDGRESIQGHIDRIHEKLDGKYNMSAVKIIPIHLLAAQKAMCSEKEESIAKILWDGSNFLEFTNSIKKDVYDSGCLKKSLSVIEGSAYQIHNIYKSISTDCNVLEQNKDILKKRYGNYKQFISGESSRLLADIDTEYETCRNALHNRAASFAEENYDNKDAGKKWANDSVVRSILNKLNKRIDSRVEDCREKAKTELEELLSDISVTTNPMSSASGESVKNTRLGVGIVGALLTAVTPIVVAALMSNPIGWVIAVVSIGVGLVVTWITSLFTSKEEKVLRATEKLKKQLDVDIDKSMDSSKEKCLMQLCCATKEMAANIDAPFNKYITGVNQLVKNLKKLLEILEFDEKVINSLIGFRILDFVGKSPVKDRKVSNFENSELVAKYPVERNWDNHTLTYLYPIKCTAKQLFKAENATQMNIKI